METKADLFGDVDDEGRALSGDPTTIHNDFFRRFEVKNLDTGETVHVDELSTYLANSTLHTFGAPEDSASGLQCVCTGAETSRDGGRSHATYNFTVRVVEGGKKARGGARSWSISRRYREFTELDGALRALMECLGLAR